MILPLMAARRIYDSPPEQMIRLARIARGAGVDFEVWWERCVRPGLPPVLTTSPVRPVDAVQWPSDSVESREWREATVAIKDSWRRAYDQMEPSRGDSAVTRLAPLLRPAAA